MQREFDVIALAQLGDDDFDVLLAGAAEQKFLGLRIAGEAERQVFFENFVDGHADAVFVRARFRLDREGDRRFGNCARGIKDGRGFVAERFAGSRVFQLGDGADVARVQVRTRLTAVFPCMTWRC